MVISVKCKQVKGNITHNYWVGEVRVFWVLAVLKGAYIPEPVVGFAHLTIRGQPLPDYLHAQVRPQHLWHLHRSVGVLVILQHRYQGPGQGQA